MSDQDIDGLEQAARVVRAALRERAAQDISDRLKELEAAAPYPADFFKALEIRRERATLLNRAEIMYQIARGDATIAAAPRAKNADVLKALVDVETYEFKTLVTRTKVLAEESANLVRFYLGANASPEPVNEAA